MTENEKIEKLTDLNIIYLNELDNLRAAYQNQQDEVQKEWDTAVLRVVNRYLQEKK